MPIDFSVSLVPNSFYQRTRANDVNFVWFADEKVFTVATAKNPQNDRLYAPVGVRKGDINAKRLLRTRTTFSQSVMVSVGVSKLGSTHLIFVDPGVKINGDYYRDVLLMQEMLPVIPRFLGSCSSYSRTALLRTELAIQ